MIISATCIQWSSEQDAGMATKTGLQGEGRQGDESKQHQATTTRGDRVKTLTRTSKHIDESLLTSFCDNQILFHSASAFPGPTIDEHQDFFFLLNFSVRSSSFSKRINSLLDMCRNSVDLQATQMFHYGSSTVKIGRAVRLGACNSPFRLFAPV